MNNLPPITHLCLYTILTCNFGISIALSIKRSWELNHKREPRNAPNENDPESALAEYRRSILAVDKLNGIDIIGYAGEEPMVGRSASQKASRTKLGTFSPMYHAGYDKEQRPVWIFDYGSLALHNFLSKNQIQHLLSWQNRVFEEIEKSVEEVKREGHNITGGVGIEDYGGNHLNLMSSLNQLAAIKLLNDNFEHDEVSSLLDYGFVINLNFIGGSAYETIGANKGKSFKRWTIYGTDEKVWKKALLEKIPREELPPEYGGLDDFEPVALFPIITKKHS